jgi:hypothetical protein
VSPPLSTACVQNLIVGILIAGDRSVNGFTLGSLVLQIFLIAGDRNVNGFTLGSLVLQIFHISSSVYGQGTVLLLHSRV